MKKQKPYHSIRKAHFLGDKKAFQKFLEENMIYPKEAMENKIEGVAHVKCEVSDRGEVLKAENLHKLGYGLDEEAERLCRLMKFGDTTERGLKIKHTQTVRIPFNIPRQQTLQIKYHSTSAKEEKKTTYGYTIKF